MRKEMNSKSRIQRIKDRYTVYIWIAAIVSLAIGLVGGVYIGKTFLTDDDSARTNANTALVDTVDMENGVEDETDAVESEAGTDENVIEMAEITPEPTATPEPVPTVIATVPYGSSYSFQTQIRSDGTARMDASTEEFETLQFSITLNSYMKPEDFAEQYGDMYKLNGTEAGAGFEIVLIDYMGSATIVPQNIINISFVSETGNTESIGYQLMDAAAGGNTNVALTTNTPTTLYKRYDYNSEGEPMKYMKVQIFNDGAIGEILFELEPEVIVTPEPAVEYSLLEKGEQGDAVQALQEKLIEKGYLEGEADGDFGSKTENAIKAAQKDMGLEETGVADADFQTKLFAEE